MKNNVEKKSLSQNKKALHDYEVLEDFEAGIMLNGDEVKSIKTGQANLKGSYIDFLGEQIFTNNIHISHYKFSSQKDYDPVRKRKLLLHQKEIIKIIQALSEKGTTVIPLEFYLKKGLIKLKIGICRGKKLYDKRQTLKKRDQDIEIKRELKRFR